MRTGAAGVLVGVGPGAACTTRGVLGIGVPQATAIADVAHARSTAHARDRRVLPGDRRRRHEKRRRRLEGDRARRRRRDDRLAAGARLRSARPAASTGAWRHSTRRSRAGRASRRCRTARSRRSSPGRPTRTTGRSTCSAACGHRWRPADTRTSPSSTAPRSWSRRPCRPRARACSATSGRHGFGRREGPGARR